jgi:hypothetical protein
VSPASAVSFDTLGFLSGVNVALDSSLQHQRGKTSAGLSQEIPARMMGWLHENLCGACFRRAERDQKREKNEKEHCNLGAGMCTTGSRGSKSRLSDGKRGAVRGRKLDATSLTPVLKLKKEKGKKTFAEYGYSTKRINEKEALVESGGRSLRLTVLEQSQNGIYVCVSEPGENGGQPKAQSVVLVKRKDRARCSKAGYRGGNSPHAR